MAKKKRKRKSRRKPEQEPYPGWMWLLFGLGIGLSVAFAIYMKDRQPPPQTRPVAQQPASMSTPMQAEPTPVAVEPDLAVEEEEPRFSFYSMLPNFEVVIPEEEPDVSRDVEVEAVQEPGIYILQAGSFGDVGDADRRRAELALLGVESRVQRVMIDDRTYHRVRIGPMDNLDELNRVRSQLRAADIDVLRIRVSD
ncbi:MAG: SPOR domain-containing protein [Woeseiaceae bacterium]